MAGSIPIRSTRLRLVLGPPMAALLVLQAGCVSAKFQASNTRAVIREPRKGHRGIPWWTIVSNAYVYPAADVLQGLWVLEARHHQQAWNLDAAGEVPDGSFFENRDIAGMTPEFLEDPWPGSAPEMPLKISKCKSGATPGFVGKDRRGRTYNVKMDDPLYPQLGSAAEAVATRIFWALGYHVPAAHVVTIEGTGDAGYDGRRAAAILYIDRASGHWQFEDVRYRREMRALKVAAMWLNEVDHGDTNTLLAWDGRRTVYWLIDLNSSLGSWNGRPKTPDMGWVAAWDPMWQALIVATLGTVRPPIDPHQPVVSAAVGRFNGRLDVRRWRSRQVNRAYDAMTDQDARWMASRIGRFSEAQLAAIVRAGRYTDPADEAHILETLQARRREILAVFGGQPPDRICQVRRSW